MTDVEASAGASSAVAAIDDDPMAPVDIDAPEPADHPKPFWVKLLIIIGILFVFWCIMVFTPILRVGIPLVVDYMGETPRLEAVLVWILMYNIGVVLYIPRSVWGVTLAYCWGFWPAVIIDPICATLNGALWCLLGSTCLRAWMKPSIMGHPKLAAIDKAIEVEGPWIVLMVRLVPVLSYPLTNILVAMSTADFWTAKVLATFFGVAPLSVAYALVGVSVDNVGDLWAAARGEGDLDPTAARLQLGLLVVGFLLSFVLIWDIGRRARKILDASIARHMVTDQKTEPEDAPVVDDLREPFIAPVPEQDIPN